MIRAKCHSQDERLEVSFDATPWFEQADDDEITDLALAGFKGDFASDAVAYEMAYLPEMRRFFEYVETTPGVWLRNGFDCHVDEESATVWVKKHRPYLMVGRKIRKGSLGPKDWSPGMERDAE